MFAHLPGKFVVFEGVDGVGKSTQVAMLAGTLRELGHEVLAISTPSRIYRDDPEVRSYNESQRSRLSVTTLAVMAFADRMRTFDLEFRPQLATGGIVICDRYIYSALVYFRERGADLRVLDELFRCMAQPDYGFLLTLPAGERQRRITSRNSTSDWEERDGHYLSRVERNLINLWPRHFAVIDASSDQSHIQTQVLAHLKEDLR